MASRTAAKPGLVVCPQTARFSGIPGEPGEEELAALLHQQRGTRPVTISKEPDVLLDSSGQVQRKYRLTSVALTQLCGILAPGFSTAIASLAGVRRRPNFPDEEYSIQLAIRFVNEMIRTRFELLRGQGLIVDERACVIEGVVGTKYRFLSNLELYQRVKASVGPAARFYEAAVAGRRLILRFRNPDRAFALPTPHDKLEPFYPGWHFSNSELGDCCVKSSAVLIRQWANTASLVPFTKQSKLIHYTGANFDSGLSKLLELAKKRAAVLPEVASHMAAMSERGLGFDGSQRGYQSQLERLGKTLRKWKVSRHLTKEVLARTLLHGSYRADRLDSEDGLLRVPEVTPTILSTIESRSVYDFYNALCASAKNGSPDQQEHVEEAAYRLMVNSTTFD